MARTFVGLSAVIAVPLSAQDDRQNWMRSMFPAIGAIRSAPDSAARRGVGQRAVRSPQGRVSEGEALRKLQVARQVRLAGDHPELAGGRIQEVSNAAP